MRKAALFIDAGHYFAETAKSAYGRPVSRNLLHCNHAGLLDTLFAQVREHDDDGGPLRLLRCYWYDGAPNGIPTREQEQIGRLPGVKVRVGKVASSGQKGVDGRIILDLLTLAQRKAIDTAFLLSGDEDLREAVLEAQQLGVQIILLGIPPEDHSHNQADSLIREADRHIVLPIEFWSAHLEALTPVNPPDLPDAASASTTDESEAGTNGSLREIVSGFVESELSSMSGSAIQELRDGRPEIPSAIDGHLLRWAETHVGDLRGRQAIRHELRAAFWEIVEERATTT